jgi:hypothetical protein
MSITIEHKVDETHMEIYEFDKSGNIYYYSGIMFSNRNDENDIWGHEWPNNKELQEKKEEEIMVLAREEGYSSASSFEYDVWNFDSFYHYTFKLMEIAEKYNPCCNKTKSGEPYYYGCSWGSYDDSDYKKKNPPKISVDKIREEILNKVSKIKIVL